jgi:hypothetical protein
MSEDLFEESGEVTVGENDLLNQDPRLREDWGETVMGMFTKKELVKMDGQEYPNVAGLRRVAEIVLGPIELSEPVQVWPYDGTRATVQYRVVFREGGVYGEVADVSGDNIDQGFLAFAVASASTRAEARCLRKALKIAKIAAEELDRSPNAATKQDQKPETESRKNITTSQLDLIDNRCKSLDINAKKLLLGTKYERVEDVEFEDAKKKLGKIHEYVNGDKEVAKSLVGYKENWRN